MSSIVTSPVSPFSPKYSFLSDSSEERRYILFTAGRKSLNWTDDAYDNLAWGYVYNIDSSFLVSFEKYYSSPLTRDVGDAAVHGETDFPVSLHLSLHIFLFSQKNKLMIGVKSAYFQVYENVEGRTKKGPKQNARAAATYAGRFIAMALRSRSRYLSSHSNLT